MSNIRRREGIADKQGATNMGMTDLQHPLPWRTEAQRMPGGSVVIVAANNATVGVMGDEARADVIVRAVNALSIMRVIAYPRMGTAEMNYDRFDMAEQIQQVFTLEELCAVTM